MQIYFLIMLLFLIGCKPEIQRMDKTSSYKGESPTEWAGNNKQSKTKPSEIKSQNSSISQLQHQSGNIKWIESGSQEDSVLMFIKPVIIIFNPQITRSIKVIRKSTTVIKGRIKDDLKVKWVTINGQDVELQSDGSFELVVNLEKGENQFIINTMNQKGLTAEKTFTITRKSKSSTVEKISGIRPNIHALLIGINKFQDDRISGLNFSEADVKSFYDFLVNPSRGGISPNNVSKLIGNEASATAMEKQLKKVVRVSSPDDLIIIYMATHGLPDPEGGNELYFLSEDSNLDSLLKTAISKSDLEKIISRYISDRKILLIVDACHAGGIGMSSSLLVTSNTRSIKQRGFRLLNKLANSSNGLGILSASRANELSQEGEKWGGGHGVFTYYLIRGLEGEADMSPVDGFVTLREIREFLYDKVSEATYKLQTPELIGDYDPNLPLSVVE